MLYQVQAANVAEQLRDALTTAHTIVWPWPVLDRIVRVQDANIIVTLTFVSDVRLELIEPGSKAKANVTVPPASWRMVQQLNRTTDDWRASMNGILRVLLTGILEAAETAGHAALFARVDAMMAGPMATWADEPQRGAA
jgi:hypothetical protein